MTALDAYGNTATGYTGTVNITSSDGQAVLPANHTFTGANAGVFTFTNGVTLKTSGSQSITATDTIFTTVTGSQTGITVNPGAATTLAVTGFPNPTAAGSAGSVTVTAQDGFGNTVTGYTGTVKITSSDGQAVLPANHTFTGFNAGVFTFANGVTLKTLGSQSITATDTLHTTITGSETGITVNPGAATHFTVAGFASPVTAGTPGSVTVTAFDALGNVATGYTGTVKITSSDAQAVLPANHTFTGANAGVFTFTNGVTLETSGTQSITATDTTSGAITGSQTGIRVNAAAPNQWDIIQQPGTTTAGNAINPAVTVQAQDSFGNAVADNGVTVTMSINSGPGTFTGTSTLTATTNAAGLATFSNLVLDTSGGYTINASGTLTAATSNSFTVNPAAANRWGIVQQPGTTTAGSAIAPAVTVQAQDSFGNAVADNGVTVTMSINSGSGTFTGTSTLTTRTTAAGLATFSNLVLNTAGSYTIKASGTLTAATSNSFTVNPAAANQWSIIQQPGTTTAGSAIAPAVTAQAEDSFGNVVADNGVTVTMSINSGPGTFTGTSTLTATTSTAGLATFSNLVLDTSGSYTIKASGTLTAATSNSFTVNPAAATHLAVTGFPNPATAGSAGSVTVTALDAFGNTATGYTGTVNITSSDGQAVLPANHIFTVGNAGVFAFTNGVTLKTSGSQSITATDTTTGTITGSQTGITVNPAAATHLAVTGFPNPATAGSAGSVTVTALDAFGNTATGYTGTVKITSSDGQAVLPANHIFTGANAGVFAFTNGVTLKTSGSQSITATDTTTGTITGSQTGITVNPGAATHFTVTGFPARSEQSRQRDGDGSGRLRQHGDGLHRHGQHHELGRPGRPAGERHLHGRQRRRVRLHQRRDPQDVGLAVDHSYRHDDRHDHGLADRDHRQPRRRDAPRRHRLPNPATAGSAGSVTVTALDAFGNTATGYTGTVDHELDGQAVLPANHIFTGANAGVFAFTNGVTLGTWLAVDHSYRHDDRHDHGLADRDHRQPGRRDALHRYRLPSPVVAGTPGSVTVTALDAFKTRRRATPARSTSRAPTARPSCRRTTSSRSATPACSPSPTA